MSGHTSEAEASQQQAPSAVATPFNMARMRSDLSSEADSEGAPSSPHFYSTSVRQNSPSIDSYSTDTDDRSSAEEHADRIAQTDSVAVQQLEQEAVKLDLLRRGHAQRAKEVLEQLQNSSAASAGGSQSGDTPRRQSAEGISPSLVRERSQQLRQASEDLRRLAVEQRSSAEDAVADFLFQEDMMMHDTNARTSEDSHASQAGSSGNLQDDDRQGMQRSLSRHLERLRRAEQAINDAEADKKMADQLVALERSMSQEKAQAHGAETTDHDTSDLRKPAEQDKPAANRHLLHNISEDSQEGHMSSNSNNSHMAASAFAAVSHLNDFDQEGNAEQQTVETEAEAATSAADPNAEHHVQQASSIDKADSSNQAQATAASSDKEGDTINSEPDHVAELAGLQSAAAADAETPFQPGSVATPTPNPNDKVEATPLADARQDSQPSQAGSSPGSHTFDSALHQGVAQLVKAPGSADHTQQQAPGDEAATYALQSDEDDDMAVVSNEEQAQAAQVAADEFMQSSRPTTPDTDYQDPPSRLPEPEEPAEQEDLASSTQRYLNDSLQQASMAEAFEPEEFKGMLYHDGVDSQGRPVIVVNTDAVGTGRKARSQAMQHMLHRLEPIVTQGPYVLVMVATGRHQNSNKLPAMWLISAYRSLSKPFRKNVQYIVLVRPTSGLKTLVAIIRPFVSSKAARKVKKVDSLAGIAAATDGEVTLQHLGSRFAAASGDYILQGIASPATASPSYDMPSF